jgi:hypothetical protein
MARKYYPYNGRVSRRTTSIALLSFVETLSGKETRSTRAMAASLMFNFQGGRYHSTALQHRQLAILTPSLCVNCFEEQQAPIRASRSCSRMELSGSKDLSNRAYIFTISWTLL